MTQDAMTSAEFLTFQAAGRPKDPHRVIAGTNARAGGEDFERALDQAHAAYLATGTASMDRLPVPTSPMPVSWLRDGKMKGISRMLARKQGFDFYGSMGARPLGGRLIGRAVAMESKATRDFKPSLGIGDKGPLRSHQVQALAEKYGQFGTMVALVWRNGSERGVMLGPDLVDAWQRVRLGVVKSVSWKGFRPYPVHAIDAGGPIEDWLAPVIAHAGEQETSDE